MSQSWILIGMMGSGKSAVGRRLAEKSGRAFVDTDTLLQTRFGRSVDSIFKVYGEAAFREHETSILRSLEPGDDIVSTGGGIVCRPENWEEFSRLGISIYLRASIDTLVARLEASQKKRPLLAGGNVRTRIQDLMSRRQALYARADHCVDVDGCEIDEVVSRVLEVVE